MGGSSRFDTAVAISQEFFFPGAPVVYLATGATFADALVAGPAAGFRRGPVLLTERDALPAVSLAELRRLGPAQIVVVGGESAISDAVLESLRREAPSVVRIGGDDRFDTAALLSRAAFAAPASVAYVATGADFADATSGGPGAALDGAPILLVQRDTLPAVTAAELTRLQPQRIVVLGQTNAVSTAVEAQLAAFSPVVERIGGPDRFETSAALSAATFTPGVPVAFLATGVGFADPLAAVPSAAISGGPVLLVRPSCVPQPVLDELDRLRPTRIILLGGATALSPDIDELVACTN